MCLLARYYTVLIHYYLESVISQDCKVCYSHFWWTWTK